MTMAPPRPTISKVPTMGLPKSLKITSATVSSMIKVRAMQAIACRLIEKHARAILTLTAMRNSNTSMRRSKNSSVLNSPSSRWTPKRKRLLEIFAMQEKNFVIRHPPPLQFKVSQRVMADAPPPQLQLLRYARPATWGLSFNCAQRSSFPGVKASSRSAA